MSVLRAVIFGVFAVFSVNSLPLTENSNFLGFSSKETNEIGDKEYKGYSEIRTIPSLDLDKEFVVFNDHKLIWAEARDACLSQGMFLASPETEAQMVKLKNYLRDNDLVPADAYSGYWVGGKRYFGETQFTWQYTGRRVGFFGWLPEQGMDFIGEECIELKNSAGVLELNNRYCDNQRGYICEKPLPQESMKNSGLGMKDKIHEETMKYIVQDLLQQISSISRTSEESGSISTATYETDSVSSDSDSITSDETILVSSTTEDISDDLEASPAPIIHLPAPYYDYSYDDYYPVNDYY